MGPATQPAAATWACAGQVTVVCRAMNAAGYSTQLQWRTEGGHGAWQGQPAERLRACRLQDYIGE